MGEVVRVYDEINTLLDKAKSEEFLSKNQNEMYADMANLKESIESVVDKGELKSAQIHRSDRLNLKKAVLIINEFENFLYERGVEITNEDREGDIAAIIYGDDYYNLEDAVLEIIENE